LSVVICLLAAVVSGCSTQNASEPSQTAPQKVAVLLDWFPNTNHTGLYVAQDQGYYAAEGLDVTIVQPSGGSNPQLVATDQADFAVSYQEEVTTARSHDIPVVALAAVIQHNKITQRLRRKILRGLGGTLRNRGFKSLNGPI